MASNVESLINTTYFDLVGADLGKDLEFSLNMALDSGAVFSEGTDPLDIFRKALASSIVDIETHPRGKLFQEFLLKGPYEDSGEIPEGLENKRLSDADTASAITFIYSHMVNCFKGAVTEILATYPCMHLLRQLKQYHKLPSNAQLYIGDSVGIHRSSERGFLKGGDQHVLIRGGESGADESITLAGVTEVKSYLPSQTRLRQQLDRHIQRAKMGLRIAGIDYSKERIKVGYGPGNRVLFISVVPARLETAAGLSI